MITLSYTSAIIHNIKLKLYYSLDIEDFKQTNIISYIKNC